MGFLQIQKENSIATILLNRPPANALSSGLIRELSDVLTTLENDSAIKVIVLKGEGRFFSAGADIKEFTTITTEADFAKLGAFGQEVFDRIEKFPKLIIAAIHGAALGGGLELAMACHIRLVSEEAKLGLPELQLGLIPGFAGTQRLPRYVGNAKALEMLVTSEPISGVEAVKWGLATAAYPESELFTKAYELAHKATQKSAQSIRYTLDLLHYAARGQIGEGQKKESEYFGKVFMSEDGQEGVTAFIEKRKPHFKQ
ncbi:enoyl-CoA hydratase [Fictibacillus macauensis ZFHKF-1]|uniref:Enoyl-CoA hydratase n=1 Tax=Fictibacillus macauensis ZFHKF-1 TaxID=1196324 RepID=I8J0X7_9BACL|nr:enoyl-CoA hydratase [Fictibacillus macauensis]EIT85411.1 enoyl-CoA hydratase [Fictibacillus macauensis ZFHKF-1]